MKFSHVEQSYWWYINGIKNLLFHQNFNLSVVNDRCSFRMQSKTRS